MSRDVTLPSGVQVRLSSVPSMIVQAVLNSLPQPRVPMWHNPDKDRDEPNPNDPEYLEAVQDVKNKQGQLATHAYLANGVKVLELPEDKYVLESDEWIEGLEFLGIQVPRTGIGRRVAWLQYHVLADEDLVEIITGIALAGGGVTEDQVNQAADSFRPNENGAALTIIPTQTELRFSDTTDNTTWSSD